MITAAMDESMPPLMATATGRPVSRYGRQGNKVKWGESQHRTETEVQVTNTIPGRNPVEEGLLRQQGSRGRSSTSVSASASASASAEPR